MLWLAKGLVELGHEVTVAALAGSQLPPGVRLLPVAQEQVSDRDLLPRLPGGLDVIHFMAPPAADTWARLPCPGLLTVHGNGKPGETFPPNTVFLSADHARRHGREAYVHNGLDPAEYLFAPEGKGDALLFLSKTSWRVKNVRGAIALAGRAGAKLWVAGGHRPWGPRLKLTLRSGSKWLGPVGGVRKAWLLSRARALIFPVLWPEPFGLVVVEALVSGTPVLAPPIGSLPELIDPSVGALIPLTDENGWIQALRDTSSRRFPAEACRDWALRKFHYLGMARTYVRAYEQLRAGHPLAVAGSA